MQLPDDVYARARKGWERLEKSFAELCRRGLEYILNVYALETEPTSHWQPRKPGRLGWKNLNKVEIKKTWTARLSSRTSSSS